MYVSVTPAYGVEELDRTTGISFLRKMFPEGEANPLNFCLFSTSGTHGSYLSIEEVAESLNSEEPCGLTVLVVQPRTVRMLYGEIDIELSDVPFLMALRASSREIAASI
jgi:hypothetical protein